MYAVGVGKAVEEELREIASEPAELHVSYSPDFNTMTHLLENLKGSICPGELTCLRTALHLSLPNPQYLSFLFTPNPFIELEAEDGLTRQSLVPPSVVRGPVGSHLVVC